MLYWISTRRFNYLDGINIALFANLIEPLGWLKAGFIMIVGVAISGIAEVKSGHNYHVNGGKRVR